MKVLIRNIIFTLKKSFIPFAVNIVIHSMYGILPVLAAYLWKILIDYIQRYMDGSEADTGKVLLYVFIYCASYGVSVALPVAFELIDTLLRNSIKEWHRRKYIIKWIRYRISSLKTPKQTII